MIVRPEDHELEEPRWKQRQGYCYVILGITTQREWKQSGAVQLARHP